MDDAYSNRFPREARDSPTNKQKKIAPEKIRRGKPPPHLIIPNPCKPYYLLISLWTPIPPLPSLALHPQLYVQQKMATTAVEIVMK